MKPEIKFKVNDKVRFNHWGSFGTLIGIVEEIYPVGEYETYAIVRISEGKLKGEEFSPATHRLVKT